MPSDISIAKNYLDKKELTELNRIVNMYLDYAEMQAARSRAMTMKDWIEKLNAFLKFNEQEILTNAGKISHDMKLRKNLLLKNMKNIGSYRIETIFLILTGKSKNYLIQRRKNHDLFR